MSRSTCLTNDSRVLVSCGKDKMGNRDKYVRGAYAVQLTEDWAGNTRCYVARNPALPGCMAQGETPLEAVKNLADAREMYIDSLLEDGQPVPEPITATAFRTEGFRLQAATPERPEAPRPSINVAVRDLVCA